MTTHDFVALWVVNIILLVLTFGLAVPLGDGEECPLSDEFHHRFG